MPANSYTRTVSCEKGIGFVFVLILIAVLISFFLYSIIRDPKKSQKSKEIATPQAKEVEEICQKLHQLDSTDLSKADGFIEALLTNEKYQNPAEENIQESD